MEKDEIVLAYVAETVEDKVVFVEEIAANVVDGIMVVVVTIEVEEIIEVELVLKVVCGEHTTSEVAVATLPIYSEGLHSEILEQIRSDVAVRIACSYCHV